MPGNNTPDTCSSYNLARDKLRTYLQDLFKDKTIQVEVSNDPIQVSTAPNGNKHLLTVMAVVKSGNEGFTFLIPRALTTVSTYIFTYLLLR